VAPPTIFSAFSKKKFSDDPQFLHVSVEPLVIYNCALYNIIENSRTVCEIFDF